MITFTYLEMLYLKHLVKKSGMVLTLDENNKLSFEIKPGIKITKRHVKNAMKLLMFLSKKPGWING